MTSVLRDRLLASTIIAGIAIAAAPAEAQTAAQTDGTTTSAVVPSVAPQANAPATGGTDAPTGSEIVVTGSRIPQPNLTSASPVTVLNSQEAKLQGTTRVEDLINSLPQAFAAQNSAVSNGSSGTATLNLRNLGAQRTLVLINGRRLQPGDPASPFPDVNIIPAPLIKRVDVLTGGASSVYGSDAVAGVVNFILDTDYSGFGVDSQYGFFQHDNNDSYFQDLNAASGFSAPSGNTVDGRQFDVTAKFGAGFDDNRGHLVGYFGYRKISPVAQSARDYSNCGVAAQAGGGFKCSGSSVSFPAVFTTLDGSVYQTAPNGGLTQDISLFNANPYNYYQRADKRYVAGFIGHYDVADAFKPYVEFNFMDDRTRGVIAPSGDFNNTSTINCDNPFLSAAQSAVICAPGNLVTNSSGAPATFLNPDGTAYTRGNLLTARRNVEGGGRDADLRHTDYRAVVGAKGDIAKGVSYDGYFSYGATEYNLIYRNEYSVSRTARAIDVINGPNGPTCRSVVDGSDPSCVPFNIFSTGNVDSSLLNYLQTPGFQNGENIEKVVNGSITVLGSEYGVQSPWADQGIGLNFGGEYRSESTRLETDNAFTTGDLAGQGGATLPFHGSFDVKEAFVELQVPLVSDKPFFHSLSIDGGYRYSDYSTSGSVSAYKGQITWAPIRDITFRGGYNRAVRAPNVLELFKGQTVNIDGTIDPCTNDLETGVPTFTAAQCALTGVSAAQYGKLPANPSVQYNGLTGGNRNLTPEKADTYTVGIVLQPSFLRGFSATVDAYQIKVKNVINFNAINGTGIGGDLIIQSCGLTGDPAACAAIHRDRFGSLWQTPDGYIRDTIVNSGTIKTRGIDATVNYTLRTDNIGTFGFNFDGTYTDELRRKVLITDVNCAGAYGNNCGVPAPKWRHRARLSWDLPMGLGLSGQWRFFGTSHFENTLDAPGIPSDFNPADAKIKSVSFFDLVATAKVGDHYNLRAGVNNILDKQPPILGSAAAPVALGNGNTYPQIYDALGRYVFVGVSLNL